MPSCKNNRFSGNLSKNKNYNGKIIEIGERPAEKLHEVMVTSEEARHAFKFKKFYKILPMLPELVNKKN